MDTLCDEYYLIFINLDISDIGRMFSVCKWYENELIKVLRYKVQEHSGLINLDNYNKRELRRVMKCFTKKNIIAGSSHSFILTDEGKLYGLGRNQDYCLGLENDFRDDCIPTFVVDNIKQVSAGHDFSLFLDKNGKVWSAGQNMYGKLGLGLEDELDATIGSVAGIKDIIQISSGVHHSLLLNNLGQVYAFGMNDDL